MVGDALDIGAQVRLDGEALARKVRGGTGAEAEIFAARPVLQIVAGAETGLGKIGNLVVLVAVVLQNFRGGKVHIGLHVVIREVGAVAVLPQGRVRLDLEGVAGHVLRLEAQDVLERAAPAGERLVRQAEHQVEREVGKARLARADDGHARLLVGMRAAEALEHVVLIGLHADGDAVEARRGPAA